LTWCVRDILLADAYSFNLLVFLLGWLQHGATYTCDVEFICDALNPGTNWVLDIGMASEVLAKVLSKYNLKNLDEIFGDELTTTEFMARRIHEDICSRLGKVFRGDLCVKLWESHKAWASYTGAIGSD